MRILPPTGVFLQPEYPSLTLDTSTATKTFDKVKTILGQTRGVTGVPLLYVIRVALVPPEDDDDDPAFRDEDSKYISIDMEMIARAPILSDEADTSNKDTSDLEANGPFVPTFPVDSKKVWVILLACFGLSSTWQYVKKFANHYLLNFSGFLRPHPSQGALCRDGCSFDYIVPGGCY